MVHQKHQVRQHQHRYAGITFFPGCPVLPELLGSLLGAQHVGLNLVVRPAELLDLIVQLVLDLLFHPAARGTVGHGLQVFQGLISNGVYVLYTGKA